MISLKCIWSGITGCVPELQVIQNLEPVDLPETDDASAKRG